MIYKVLFDGMSIYNDDPSMTLVSPSVETELNSAGSFEFTMPPKHFFYNNIKMLTPSVEVYEDGTLIWFGRPINSKIDFWNQKKIYCEGALAYFNDSIQRPIEYADVSVISFFKTLIANHNSQVPANRQFTAGNVTIADKYVYRKLDYDVTLDALKTMCVDAEGGYLYTRKVDGVQYIDWLKDVPYTGDQPVQFALNILDLSQEVDMSEVATAVIPLGKEVDGAKITIASVNSGKDYLDSEAVSTYGRISKKVDFDTIATSAALLTKAQEWLAEQQFENFTIECDAAELHYIDDRYTAFQVGQKVHCTSSPHLIDTNLPITKMSVNLDSSSKKITIGTPEKKQLTEIVKDSSSVTSSISSSTSSSGGGSSGTVDTAMSDSSTNAVQNKIIKQYVDDRVVTVDDTLSDTSVNPVQNKIIKEYVDSHTSSAGVLDSAMSDTSANAVQNKVIKEYVDDGGIAEIMKNGFLYETIVISDDGLTIASTSTDGRILTEIVSSNGKTVTKTLKNKSGDIVAKMIETISADSKTITCAKEA